MLAAPAFANSSTYFSGSTIIRWQSSGVFACLFIAATTSGPQVMFGTNRPSITSTWIQSAPPCSTARISSRCATGRRRARTARSARRSCGSPQARGEEASVPVRCGRCGEVASRQSPESPPAAARCGIGGMRRETAAAARRTLRGQRADRVDEQAAGRTYRAPTRAAALGAVPGGPRPRASSAASPRDGGAAFPAPSKARRAAPGRSSRAGRPGWHRRVAARASRFSSPSRRAVSAMALALRACRSTASTEP